MPILSRRLPAIAALLLLACPLASLAAAPSMKVGFICPLTEGSGDFGNSARLGIELAVKEINEVGGFLERPFEPSSRCSC